MSVGHKKIALFDQTESARATFGLRLIRAIAWVILSTIFLTSCSDNWFESSLNAPINREEVVFWHFWGGPDRVVVESVVARFNASQEKYFVRAVAMPGNNLQAKLFLAVAGGDPPDLVNQDDPVLADWAWRGVIQPLDAIASPQEVAQVRDWMLPAARRLSTYEHHLFAVCNGLDVRALYYNQTVLDRHSLSAPTTISELDHISDRLTDLDSSHRPTVGFLPDSRRLWSWGFVFGGDFVVLQQESNHATTDEQAAAFDSSSTIRVDLQHPSIRAALEWMADYARRYGADRLAAYRAADQSLPGKSFPLLPTTDIDEAGRYVIVMDGQWRVRDIEQFQQRRRSAGLPVTQFGVCPLPIPDPGDTHDNSEEAVSTAKSTLVPRERAGWVNGNFFVVPRGAKHSAGAWEFMKFWIGFTDPAQAATTCASGGWIPVSSDVIRQPVFQDFLARSPLFKTFVELANSPHQYPTPVIPGAAMLRREVENMAYQAMVDPENSVPEILAATEQRIQHQLERILVEKSQSLTTSPTP